LGRRVIDIRDATDADRETLLRINRAARPHVAPLDAAEVGRLVGLGGRVVVAVEDDRRAIGYAILIGSECAYDGEEFSRFRENSCERFLYIDQIALESPARGRGIATTVYRHVERIAHAAGTNVLCCEVNVDPPNPASRRFHARFGFVEIGDMNTADGRRVVLLRKRLEAPQMG
jgi:uncharacterized protein